MGAYEEYQATGDEDMEECAHCDAMVRPEVLDRGGWCPKCVDEYDGPSDDDLSEFYGGGGVRPMEEQYREAAEFKRKLG
jgi:hypothetical protein